MATILIADDEAGIVSLLQDYFTYNGYRVMVARNGLEALKGAEQNPDLILLDINMPGLDGMQVCQRIREAVSCPILFLTARIEEADRVNGFRAGGDDYVTKPFSLEELGARVAAHLRREQRLSARTRARFAEELTLDYARRTVSFQGQGIALTRKEFDIVALLSMHPGQVFDRERIYERVWGLEGAGDNAVVAEHIRRIRGKFAAHTRRAYIETVWGVGYKWVG